MKSSQKSQFVKLVILFLYIANVSLIGPTTPSKAVTFPEGMSDKVTDLMEA